MVIPGGFVHEENIPVWNYEHEAGNFESVSDANSKSTLNKMQLSIREYT